jgi:hypothetical protein
LKNLATLISIPPVLFPPHTEESRVLEIPDAGLSMVKILNAFALQTQLELSPELITSQIFDPEHQLPHILEITRNKTKKYHSY